MSLQKDIHSPGETWGTDSPQPAEVPGRAIQIITVSSCLFFKRCIIYKMLGAVWKSLEGPWGRACSQWLPETFESSPVPDEDMSSYHWGPGAWNQHLPAVDQQMWVSSDSPGRAMTRGAGSSWTGVGSWKGWYGLVSSSFVTEIILSTQESRSALVPTPTVFRLAQFYHTWYNKPNFYIILL